MAKRKAGRTWRRRSADPARAVGAALGHVAARVDSWKQQRVEIEAEIRKLIGSAERLLADLGRNTRAGVASAVAVLPNRKGGRPKGYRTSDATRRKLRAAWRRRKAAGRAAHASAKTS